MTGIVGSGVTRKRKKNPPGPGQVYKSKGGRATAKITPARHVCREQAASEAAGRKKSPCNVTVSR